MNQLSWGAHIVPVIDCFNPTKQICSSVGVQHTKQGGKYRVIEASLPAPNCSAVIHQPNKTIDTINSPISLYTSGGALDFLDFLGCLKIVIPLNPCFSDHFPHSKNGLNLGVRNIPMASSNHFHQVFGARKKGPVAKLSSLHPTHRLVSQ